MDKLKFAYHYFSQISIRLSPICNNIKTRRSSWKVERDFRIARTTATRHNRK